MAQKKTRTNTRKDWAIYTYIAGDNNLSDYGLLDISEMEKAGGSRNLHIAIQMDTAGEHDGSVRYEIGEPDFSGESHRAVIMRLPEQNTGDPRYLADFAKWASERYPARNRLLVIWNHGAGFMHTPTRDIGYDDSSKGDALTMGELRWALERAGYGNGALGRLAILGFDACLMNMLEVAYEFVGLADLIVGSQQTEPGDGWPYADVILGMQRGAQAPRVAKNIVDKYIAYYKNVGTSGVTQSAVELRTLASVGKAVDSLGAALIRTLPTSADSIREARVKTLGYEEPTYVDLTDLVDQLATSVGNSKVKSSCRAVKAAVSKAVILNGTYGATVKQSKGLSIWFPLLNTDYVQRRGEYVALRYSTEFEYW